MKTKLEQLNEIEKIVLDLDIKFKNKQVTESFLEKTQDILDYSAERLEDDSTLGSNKYILFELQSLIEIVKGNFSRARDFATESYEMMDSEQDFVSKTVSNYFQQLDSNDTSLVYEDDEEESEDYSDEFSGNFEGWLVLYTLRLTLLPIILTFDFFSSISLSEVPSPVNTYLTVIAVFDLLIAAGGFYVWYYYFSKSEKTISYIWMLEGTLIAYYIIGSLWLASLADEYSALDMSEVGGQIGYSLISFIWLLYWVFSRRVEATFVED